MADQFCTQCGRAIETGAQFCNSCGTVPSNTKQKSNSGTIVGIIIGAVALFVMVGLLTSKNSSETKPVITEAARPATIETALNIPADFKPSYKIARNEISDSPGAKRRAVSITVPPDLDPSALELTLKHAVKTIYENGRQDAIVVWAYRNGESIDQPYTLAMLTFAPDGEWGNASPGLPLDRYKVIFQLRQ